MAHFLFQVAYTAETWATLVKKPQNRIDAVRPVIERAGGKVESAYLAFGEYDVVLLAELPDNLAASACAMAFAAGGALKSMKTTPLVSWEEGIAAMRKAGEVGYRPPG